MKNFKTSVLILVMSLSAIGFTSCDDNDVTPPISNGVSVTINNTFQSTAFQIPNETAIEAIFDVPTGSLFATATVSNELEFDDYLLNLYDVDIQENSINFTMSAQAGDPTYNTNFRTIEAGTTDRYYLNFDNPHNVSGFTSNNSSVNLRIDSPTTLVVEIGEGYDFNPGIAFSIALK